MNKGELVNEVTKVVGKKKAAEDAVNSVLDTITASLKKGDKVILVDDVATTGKALIEAKRVLDEAGVVIESAIVIVDRKEGAKENLAEIGVPLESIFTIHDFEG